MIFNCVFITNLHRMGRCSELEVCHTLTEDEYSWKHLVVIVRANRSLNSAT